MIPDAKKPQVQLDVEVNVNNEINVLNKLPTAMHSVLYHDQLAIKPLFCTWMQCIIIAIKTTQNIFRIIKIPYLIIIPI